MLLLSRLCFFFVLTISFAQEIPSDPESGDQPTSDGQPGDDSIIPKPVGPLYSEVETCLQAALVAAQAEVMEIVPVCTPDSVNGLGCWCFPPFRKILTNYLSTHCALLYTPQALDYYEVGPKEVMRNCPSYLQGLSPEMQAEAGVGPSHSSTGVPRPTSSPAGPTSVSASSNKKVTKIGAIVGAVIGFVLVLCALGGFLMWVRRKRRSANLVPPVQSRSYQATQPAKNTRFQDPYYDSVREPLFPSIVTAETQPKVKSALFTAANTVPTPFRSNRSHAIPTINEEGAPQDDVASVHPVSGRRPLPIPPNRRNLFQSSSPGTLSPLSVIIRQLTGSSSTYVPQV